MISSVIKGHLPWALHFIELKEERAWLFLSREFHYS